MNNLDPEVAENPDELVVYGGTGKAARSWEAFEAIVRTLRTLAGDETLLVQSGKPVGVFTHPRVGTSCPDRQLKPRSRVGHLGGVPPAGGAWADDVRADDRRVVDLHRQPGDRPGDLECFAEIARRRHGGRLAGTITLTAGLGGMGGAQPLAVTMNGGVALCVEVDRTGSSAGWKRGTSMRSAGLAPGCRRAVQAAKAGAPRAQRRDWRQMPPTSCRSCSTPGVRGLRS